MKHKESYNSKQDQWWPTDRIAVPCLHNPNFPCDCPLKRYSAKRVNDVVKQMHHGESHGIAIEFENCVLNPRFFGTIASLLTRPNWPCPGFVDHQYGVFSPRILKFREQIVVANKLWFNWSGRRDECFVWQQEHED